jgi:hypothetical protein
MEARDAAKATQQMRTRFAGGLEAAVVAPAAR